MTATGVSVASDDPSTPAVADPTCTAVTIPDTSAPDTTLTAAPPDPSSEATPTFAFTGTDNTGVTGFQCRIGTGVFATCSSPYTTEELDDGEHTFEVRAVDAAGNTDTTPAAHTWTIDTAAPDTTLTATPPDPSSEATPTFSFTGTGTNFECRVDTGVFVTCASPYTTEELDDGEHTFEVRAVDAAGNPYYPGRPHVDDRHGGAGHDPDGNAARSVLGCDPDVLVHRGQARTSSAGSTPACSRPVQARTPRRSSRR